MRDKPPAPIKQPPKPTRNAADIAKLVTGLTAAFIAQWYPEAAIAGAVFPVIIDRYVNRPLKLLFKELEQGNIGSLSSELFAAFIPMTYKLLEKAKEGEYEHNLRILAAYLVGELKQDVPEPGNFSNMARRVEGLSAIDLKVMALIDASQSQITHSSTDEGTERSRPYVSVGSLKQSRDSQGLTRADLAEALVDLGSRGFLIPDGATRTGKMEEYFYVSRSFLDLMDRARARVTSAST